MIRINLLAVEKKAIARVGGKSFQVGQKITIACSLILIVGALFVGWRYWTLRQDSARIDREIAEAQQEKVRLRSIMQQVEQFEHQKAELQTRVALIEELRTSQTGPVHMLDQISRAVPPMLWLTELKQTEDSVVIDGRCTGLTSLSDFVTNLEASGYFKRSVEIVSTQAEANTSPAGEMIKFSIKGQFQQPGEAAKP
jgi:type IV pilus assembly protein PilN